MDDQRVRVFVVDDHPIVNKGLVSLEANPANGIVIAGQAFSGQEAIEKLSQTDADVVLMDIRLPDIDGIEVGRRIKEQSPDTKIVMLTTFNDREYIKEATGIGAEGFLLKEVPEEVIVSTIWAVAEGKIYISTETDTGVGGGLFASNTSRYDAKTASDSSSTLPSAAGERSSRDSGVARERIERINKLSQREQEIFMLLAHGKDNREIADALFISEHTVRNYVSKIYSILELKNRTAAIVWAQENGVV